MKSYSTPLLYAGCRGDSQTASWQGLRIALVVHDVSKMRGHDRYVAELATALAKDHCVHVYAHTCTDIDLNQIRFHPVATVDAPDLFKILGFLVTVTRLLRKANASYDIIHTQGVCGLVQDVVTAHICQAAWQDIYQTLDHVQGTTSRQWYHRLVNGLMTHLERRLYQPAHTRHIIAISQRIKEEIATYYGRNPADITAIHNGVNLTEFNPRNQSLFRAAVRREQGIGEGDLALLYVGEFKRKGLRYAIEALALVQRRYPTVLLVLGGEDPTPYRILAERLGVGERVRFAGHVRDVARYYGAVDVLVFPTLYEPFGFAITEAMASGLPVVTSRQAGAAEIITHGEDGLLLENPRDPQEIATKIMDLAADPALRKELGHRARNRVEDLAWPLVVRRVVEVYSCVVHN